MRRASPILLSVDEHRYWHWCPACERLHPLPSSWQFNDNFARPTFTPSFKQTFVRFVNDEGALTASKNAEMIVCHYFITDAAIQFCSDSWHGRSDIVAMPPIPIEQWEDLA
jgi:hypothetical protein